MPGHGRPGGGRPEVAMYAQRTVLSLVDASGSLAVTPVQSRLLAAEHTARHQTCPSQFPSQSPSRRRDLAVRLGGAIKRPIGTALPNFAPALHCSSAWPRFHHSLIQPRMPRSPSASVTLYPSHHHCRRGCLTTSAFESPLVRCTTPGLGSFFLSSSSSQPSPMQSTLCSP